MGNQKITPTNFIATVYGNLTPLNNSAFSKARLKIFYKGLNRNGSYITDEVAEKLLATLPGTPIVGYFDGDNDDFLGHVSPEQNKPYGFVPQDMNFKWEMSLDPDGVYRTYACTDIILWTGRYPVASRVVGKSHSMELNPETVEGDWVEDGDDFYYQFTNAEFFGLCILGNEYEPCFEGSSFYELHKQEDKSISKELHEMFSLYKKELDTAYENHTGGQEMEDKEKDSVVEEVVETPAVEEEVVEETLPVEENKEEVVEDVVEENKENFEENGEEETAEPEAEEEETAEEETDSEEESEDKPEEEVEETETEEESEEEVEEEEESEEQEEPDLNAQLAEKDAEIESLKAQLAELSSYKAQKVREEKEQVINAYAKKLSEEEVENFKNKIDEFESAIELKKEIALCILDKEISEEADESSNFSLVKNHKEELKGAEAILARYAKK